LSDSLPCGWTTGPAVRIGKARQKINLGFDSIRTDRALMRIPRTCRASAPDYFAAYPHDDIMMMIPKAVASFDFANLVKNTSHG
jgi:hypothetical protein